MVFGFRLVYKCVFIALWSTKMMWVMWFDCLRVVRICSTVCASYIIFLFNENSHFIKEIKHVVRTSVAYWKPWQSLWEFSSRWKPSTASCVFTNLLLNSPKCSPWFSPGYEGTENMFYFLIVNMLFIFINLLCIFINMLMLPQQSEPE